MHKTKKVNTNTRANYLRLVRNNSTPLAIEQPEILTATSVESREIRYLTVAMMNRLWIPQSSSIVGLLNVGISKDNFEELSKWITAEQAMACSGCASNDLKYLEKRFRDSVTCYPEN